MKVVIEFETSNAAFDDFNGEVSRVLDRCKQFAYVKPKGRLQTYLLDSNGNIIGYAYLEPNHEDGE